VKTIKFWAVDDGWIGMWGLTLTSWSCECVCPYELWQKSFKIILIFLMVNLALKLSPSTREKFSPWIFPHAMCHVSCLFLVQCKSSSFLKNYWHCCFWVKVWSIHAICQQLLKNVWTSSSKSVYQRLSAVIGELESSGGGTGNIRHEFRQWTEKDKNYHPLLAYFCELIVSS